MRNRLGMAAAAMVMAVWGSAFAMDLSTVEDGWNANAAVAADCAPERPEPKLVIGGGANIVAYGRWVEGYSGRGAGLDTSSRRELKSSSFEPDTAALWVKVNATENNWLTVKIDLDDAWNQNTGNSIYDQDDFLEEMYFTFHNIANTGFGVKVGKMEVPFGYDKDVLLVHPYLHGTGESSFTKRVNGLNSWQDAGMTSPIDQGGYREFHSVEYDNLFAITPYWNFCDDKLLLEASLFQSKRDVNSADGRRRSNDDMFFKSGSFRVTWKPIENLVLQGSVIARYNDFSENNSTVWAARSTDYMFASSLAAEYTFDLFCRKMNVFAEWQHAWNPYNDSAHRETGTGRYFMKDSSSDDIHFGLGYQLMEKLKLHLQGEWLEMRNDRRNFGGAADADSTLWRAVIATEYKLPGGIIMESGFQYEWLKLDNIAANTANPGAMDKFGAATWYSGLKFSF